MALILDDILRACLLAFYLLSIFRRCICSDLVGTVFFAVLIFFLVYRPLSFASLSVLQFAVVLGKKKLVNLKVACGMIALCVGISLITVASTVEKCTNLMRKLFATIATVLTAGQRLELQVIS